MATNDTFGFPDDTTPTAKPGRSTGVKVLIVLAVIAGSCLLLCCGVGGYLVYWGKSMVSTDPATVATVSQKITPINVPEGLEPAFSLDVTVPMSDEFVFRTAVYGDQQTSSMLMLLGTPKGVPIESQQQMNQQLGPAMDEQGANAEELIIEESHPIELDIRGQKVTFTISTGKGAQSQSPRIEAKGSFEGQNGPVQLQFSGDAEKYDEQTVVDMLESIE